MVMVNSVCVASEKKLMWKEKPGGNWQVSLPGWLLCALNACAILIKGQNIFALTIIYGFPFRKIYYQAVSTEPQLLSTPKQENK